jgi:hypothetical protein
VSPDIAVERLSHLVQAIRSAPLIVVGHDAVEVRCPYRVGHSLIECYLIPVGLFDGEPEHCVCTGPDHTAWCQRPLRYLAVGSRA